MSTDARLTPEGARLLRMARDRIVAHPETFHWGRFCGTRLQGRGPLRHEEGGGGDRGFSLGVRVSSERPLAPATRDPLRVPRRHASTAARSG